MQVFFRLPSGKTITVELNGLETVENIFKIIKDSKKLDPEFEQYKISDIRFIYGGKQLENDRTLSDYFYRELTTIFISVRLRGGMFNETSGRNGKYTVLNSVCFSLD
jgi:hypothetical protein